VGQGLPKKALGKQEGGVESEGVQDGLVKREPGAEFHAGQNALRRERQNNRKRKRAGRGRGTDSFQHGGGPA